uniref:Family with sequence similarity 217 member B n=1 Tax=Sus scrofa TaxID=9823 RepID=A0A4X1UTB6_PIG
MGRRNRGAASRPRVRFLGVPGRAQPPGVSAGTAPCRTPSGAAAPSPRRPPRPSGPRPGLPLSAANKEPVSGDESFLRWKPFGASAERRVAPAFCFLRGARAKAVSAQRPLPPRAAALLTWLQLVGSNFPASLRPAPRDAARARTPAARAPPPPPPPPAPLPQHAAVRPPAQAQGRKASGLVTCPGRSRNSSGGEASFPNIRGIKKSLPQLSSSSNRLSKNISSTAEKTVRQTLDDDQPCYFFKRGSRVNESYQKSSNMNAGPSWTKAQHAKNPARRRQSKPQGPPGSSQLKSSPGGGGPQRTEGKRKEGTSSGGNPERALGASGNRSFLDFPSLEIIKGDADDSDSASDLSDSERVPVLPSPLTPPDLRLRAEEIDPAHEHLRPGQGPAKPDLRYPDFLPAPFNSWDLRDMAVLLHSERRAEAGPRAGGLLGRYIDRLVQLEWLQIQTIQCEKGKGPKARPPTAPGASGALKSPGRSKLMASALSRPPQEGPRKSGPSRKKDLPLEEVQPSCRAFEAPPAPLDVLSSGRLCSQKQSLNMRPEEKRKKPSKSSQLQPWDLSCADRDSSGPKLESKGNLRVPRPSAGILDSADSYKACRAQAHALLKKKGNANHCARAPVSSEKKLKTNGVKCINSNKN